MLMKVLVVAYLVVLHLLELLLSALANGLRELFHEVRSVLLHFFQNLVHVLLDGKEVSLDAFLFEEFD